MRCKKHISDFSSTVGVCSTCLRERLILLIQAQAQAQAQTQAQLTRLTSRASDECSRNSDTTNHLPPPLIFPRSVSPYVSRRKSDYATVGDRRERLFYSTPQLGPTFYAGDCNVNSNSRSLKKRLSKFWKFSNLFRTRSEKFQSDPSCEASSSDSSSWFSSILPARKKNRDRNVMAEDFSVGARRRHRHRQSDRGMSPVRTEEFTDECDQCPSGSGYSTESSPWWRRTPSVNVPSARRSRFAHGKSASGSGIFCMSPLVRASPNRRWNHKGLPPETAAAADVRTAAVKPHLSAAASFCANRSRKLADFGRVNHNR